ncbi:MAG: hypothetical protein IJH82_07585 [Lachnospiraceae bacterium]|nr:hypothetical protein [Lachnospiraceae bacterium]
MKRKQWMLIMSTVLVISMAGCQLDAFSSEMPDVNPTTEVVEMPSEEASEEILAESSEETASEDASEEVKEEPKPAAREVYLGDFKAMSNARYLDVSGIDCSELDVAGFLDSMTDLREINMKDTNLTNDEYSELQDAHPDTRIIWNIKTRYYTIPTDTVGFSTLIGYNDSRRLYNEDMKYFKYCNDMVALDFGHCCVSDISFLKYMPNLKILIIVENYPSDGSSRRLKNITDVKYCTKLRYFEFFANDVQDISSLQYLTELEDLNFCYNPVESTEYIKNLPHLQKLWIYGTHIPYEQLQELREIYPDCRIVTSGSGSVDQGWRSGDHYLAMRNMVKNNVIDPVYADTPEEAREAKIASREALKRAAEDSAAERAAAAKEAAEEETENEESAEEKANPTEEAAPVEEATVTKEESANEEPVPTE